MALINATLVQKGKVVGGCIPDNTASLGNKETVGSACVKSGGYAVDDYFVDKATGLFYVVTATINQGDTITAGTNCSQTNIGNELSRINTDLYDMGTSTFLYDSNVVGASFINIEVASLSQFRYIFAQCSTDAQFERPFALFIPIDILKNYHVTYGAVIGIQQHGCGTIKYVDDTHITLQRYAGTDVRFRVFGVK